MGQPPGAGASTAAAQSQTTFSPAAGSRIAQGHAVSVFVRSLLATAAVASALSLGVLLPGNRVAAQAAAPGIHIFETSTRPIRVVTLADKLASPWGLEFLPNADILFTERTGQLRVFRDGALVADPIHGVPQVRYKLHGGLLDVALHPNFSDNDIIYLAYSKTVFRDGKEGGSTAIFRARYDGKRLLDGRDVFVADAWTTLDVNFGSRIIFAPDGTMLVSVGDRGPNGEPLAQDLSVHNGKILRLNADGTVPDDNPFVGQVGVRPEIYSYGHRNVQGFTLHPDTGELWASEHGPLGGDEINIIQPGRNYGWPIISFGRKYDGSAITDRPWREGMEQPRFFWVPSIGISALLFYTEDRYLDWKGELFVTGMSGMMLQRIRMQGRGIAEREPLLTQLRQQVRDAQTGPDGLLYVLTRSDAYRTDDTGSLLRIEPVEVADPTRLDAER